MRSRSPVVKIISTDEAEELLDGDIPLVDVRTEEEFSDGHIPGAINVPLLLETSQGRKENPEFLEVMSALFEKDQPLVLHCKAGGRSQKACQLLEQQGYTALHDMEAGFEGKKDPFGRLIPGWSQEGREIEMEADEERTYPGALKMAKAKS